ncbi:hypothetical protein CBR_g21206 [Chara braunii]|uniref:DUF659 domain-containing protein n=1 Tax=Chara braunii TaxID=69332 RepID=A0A388L0W6_CHABU|nr:hypothetical protein CBR_g21206 [Chara braunii]|eukprot:GBG75964.1 hypothetical protein CBR_g21206 [Chara braunii]
MKNSNFVCKYVLVGQELSEKLRGQRMLQCVFCGNEWQGNRHGVARHFRSVKGCLQVTNEALMEKHNMSGYAFEGKWLERIRKKLWLRFVYSNQLPFNIFRSPTWKAYTAHFRDKPASVPVVWPFENEVASMDAVLETATDVVAGLKDIQEPFDRTGATIMSDGRKSRDGNFLVAVARGVMMYPTLNRQGEIDDALAVLGRWISVFHDFGPDRVNAICTDSVSAYVKAGNALAHPHMRPAYKRITWLPCAGHVCNKLSSDIGTVGPWLCMSRVIEWTGQLARDVEAAVKPLENELADQIFRCVQERVSHMCEPAHVVVYLLCPMRRSMQYYSDVVKDEDKRLVRKAESYILSQTGFDERRKEYRDAVLQLRDFHMRTSTCTWGGEWAHAAAEMCVGDHETAESGLRWSQYGGCAPERHRIAVRVLYMWTCSSPAERNWAIHESIHTKKHNRLLFSKVAKLVEIMANMRLLALQSAGGGLVLPWTHDESMFDVEGGLEADAICEGVDHSIPEEDRDVQAQLWRRDACGSRPLPPVEDVFGVRAATLRPYPRDDSSGDELEEADDGFRLHGAAAAQRAEDDDGTWSDPEEVHRRSSGRDLFKDTARGRFGVEGCWDGSGSPVVELPVHGAEGDTAGMRGAHQRRGPTGRGSLDNGEVSEGRGGSVVPPFTIHGVFERSREMSIADVAGDVVSGLGGAWSLGDIGTLGALPGSGYAEQFDDAHHEGAPHDDAGGGDHAMESASMRDFMAELEATLPSMTEGESVVARQVEDEDVGPSHSQFT